MSKINWDKDQFPVWNLARLRVLAIKGLDHERFRYNIYASLAHQHKNAKKTSVPGKFSTALALRFCQKLFPYMGIFIF